MSRRVSASLLGIIAMVGFLSGLAHSAPHADQVQAELLADAASIEPGKPFTLGVRLSVDLGWHVYWKNPGDSGLPTTVDFVLPDGFTVDELQYPVPQRIEQTGGIVNYGYEDEVMLLAKVTPPKDLPIGKPVHMVAKVNWLVCREECYPGNADGSIELPVSQEAKPAHADVFASWLERMPQHFTGRVTEQAPDNGPRKLLLDLPAGARDLQWFPPASDALNFKDIHTQIDRGSAIVTFVSEPIPGRKPPDKPLDSVLAYTTSDGKRAGISVPVR
jgi:thiol:disulfide interchange protein DsbD